MSLLSAKALLACERCGFVVPFMDSTCSSLAYTDDMRFHALSYKRINHFLDTLLNCQGRETTRMGEPMMRSVMEELYAQRVRDPLLITPQLVRSVVRRLRMRKAYDHVHKIAAILSGRPSLRISDEASEMCRLLFVSASPAFDKVLPADRKNFLSYNYVAYQMLRLLGYHEILPSIALLKSAEKMRRQDEIWRLMCGVLNWEYMSCADD